jgi:hypothetical protein
MPTQTTHQKHAQSRQDAPCSTKSRAGIHSASWWLNVAPEAFSTAALEELPRMLTSAYGGARLHGRVPMRLGRATTPRGVD